MLNFKDVINLPKWRPLAQPIAQATNFYGLTSDMRNNEDRHPLIYFNQTTATFNFYDVKNDQWLPLLGPSLASNFTSAFFMPAQSPRGTIAAGATTTSIPLTTALPATIGVNQLANRGDGRGFKVRIIGKAAGSSGKTEERLVIANTGQTTTPTLTLDSPLSFTPVSGDAYEFLSGRVFMIGTSNVAGSFKYYDVLTNSFSGNLATATLPASFGNSSSMVGLDELLVPYDKTPGEGFFGILTATASAVTTLTGQAVGGDASVLANEYRNFQIRIVEDTAIPTAVGQRVNIGTAVTGHTAGPSPVYTISGWPVIQPSATAKYVIENNGNRIILWVANSTQTSTYSISGNAWDASVTFAVRPLAPSTALVSAQAFSIEPDSAKNARHSFIYSFRGDGTGSIDLFNISGANTGTWTSAITYGNGGTNFSFSTQAGSVQDPATMEGRYMYIAALVGFTPVGQRFYRFDMKNRVLETYTFLRVPVGGLGSATSTKVLAQTIFIDGNTKLSFIFYNITNSTVTSQLMFGLPITR